MSDLTNKQRKLLDFIKSYSSSRGYAPSLREMADFLGVRAVSTVHQHLESIISKGYLARSSSKERNIKTGIAIPNIPKIVRIPLLGEIAAGLPIEPLEDPEPIYVSTQLAKRPEDYYALRVKGDSMVEDGVQDGDIIVVKAQNYIDRPNQVIVAITNGEATLKRFGGLNDEGKVRLLPRNPKVSVIYADPESFEVRGVLTGLVRGI